MAYRNASLSVFKLRVQHLISDIIENAGVHFALHAGRSRSNITERIRLIDTNVSHIEKEVR